MHVYLKGSPFSYHQAPAAAKSESEEENSSDDDMGFGLFD